MATATPSYYFAYGSNMNPARVRQRRMGFVRHLPGFLTGYELHFNKRSRKIPGAASANVMQADADSRVEGLVYELRLPEQIQVMDVFEGYPRLYSRSELAINTSQGQVLAWTYLAMPDHVATAEEGLRPAHWYLQHLLAGEPYLSVAYFQRLKQVECLPDSHQEPGT